MALSPDGGGTGASASPAGSSPSPASRANDADALGTQRQDAAVLFVLVAFFACAALTVESALEVLLDYYLKVGSTPEFGRAIVFAFANTDFSPKLLAAIAGLVTLGLAVIARPSKGTRRWAILTYGAMAGAALCLLLLVEYGVDRNGAVGDIPNIGVGATLEDSAIEGLRKSIQALYSGLAIWFLGLLPPLLTAPGSKPPKGTQQDA